MGRKAVKGGEKRKFKHQGSDVSCLAKCWSPGLSAGCVAVHAVHVSWVTSCVVPVTEPWRTPVGRDPWRLSDPAFRSK